MSTTIYPGVIYCPESLIGILPTFPVIDTDYVEIESKLLTPEIKLSDEGLMTLWNVVAGLPSGKHKIQFSYMYGDVDLEVGGEVSMNDNGVFWHELTATDEDGRKYLVTFDAKYFNEYYLNGNHAINT